MPQTFLIGAAQSADGSKKQQFWPGTLYQCRVYKGLLSDDKRERLHREGVVKWKCYDINGQIISPLAGKTLYVAGDSIAYGKGSAGGYGKCIADKYGMTADQ